MKRLRRFEHVGRHKIVVAHTVAADLDPDVVTAAGRDHGEVLVLELRERRKLVLNGAEFLERLSRFAGQHLLEDAGDRFEGERARRELDLAGRCYDVRLFTDVDDEGLAVETDDGLEQGRDQTHRLLISARAAVCIRKFARFPPRKLAPIQPVCSLWSDTEERSARCGGTAACRGPNSRAHPRREFP